MLAHLRTAVVVLDARLHTESLNPAAESLFSVSDRSVQGKPVAAWLPGASTLVPRFQASLRTEQGWTARELPLALGGGLHTVTADLTVTPIEDGRLILEFAGLDRHLRISREDHLHAQQTASRALVRGLAHEIKNPLGGIRGAAQLLARRLDDQKLREFTNVIIHETDRLAALVDAMLGPNDPPRREPVNIHEITERVLQLIESEFPQREAIVRDYDPSIPSVLGDVDQLVQALLNIVRNAVQAGGDWVTVRTHIERQVTIGRTRHRQVVRIDVIDDGEGIPPDMLEQIFFPLISTRPEGTGLGLSIAQSLVARHGGLIECESQSGRTVFTVLIPLENEHE